MRARGTPKRESMMASLSTELFLLCVEAFSTRGADSGIESRDSKILTACGAADTGINAIDVFSHTAFGSASRTLQVFGVNDTVVLAALHPRLYAQVRSAD